MYKHLMKFMEQSWLLVVASLMFGLLLAATDAALQPRIQANKVAKVERLIKQVMPQTQEAPVVAEVPIEIQRGKKTKPLKIPVYQAIADGETIGWAFVILGSGFADKIEMLVAIDPAGEKILGFGVLFSNETPGFGDQIVHPFFNDQFKGAPLGPLEMTKVGDQTQIDSTIVAISGATVSSQAVVNGMNVYLTRVRDAMQEAGLIHNGR